jgi:hypothetical protein
MHQIALLVALSATTGLFGGRATVQTCRGGNCYASSYRHNYTYNSYYAQPQAQAPVVAPAQARVATAPVATAPAPRTYYNVAQPRYFYTAAPSCPNGTCQRR